MTTDLVVASKVVRGGNVPPPFGLLDLGSIREGKAYVPFGYQKSIVSWVIHNCGRISFKFLSMELVEPRCVVVNEGGLAVAW